MPRNWPIESLQKLVQVHETLITNVCLLDEKGNIEMTNKAWLEFARENNADLEKVSEGCNYLDHCDKAVGEDSDLAKEFAWGIRSVIKGERDIFELEYPCHSPEEKRWFIGRVSSPVMPKLLGNTKRKVMVEHIEITGLKEAEKVHERLLKILDSIDAVIYVADIDTSEILFINQYGKNIFGNVAGMKCWKALQKGQDGPCSFCPNPKLLDSEGNPNEVFRWEHQNTYTGEWYECHDVAIPWLDGRMVKLELAVNISERKELEDMLKSYTQKVEQKNIEIEKFYNILSKEMDKARNIHERTFLADPKEISTEKGLSIEAFYYPAKELGGDFYNFIKTGNKIILYLSDVSGHGLDGTIISVFIKETIESYVHLMPNRIAPEHILNHVYDQYLKDDYPDDYFISIFLAVLDTNTYRLDYASAGMHFSPMAKLENGELISLENQGPPISTAVPKELMDFNSDSFNFTPGTTILFYTDGIAEQENQKSFLYQPRLEKVFYKHAHLSPSRIKEAINSDFKEFNNGCLRCDDDLTYVILQRKF